MCCLILAYIGNFSIGTSAEGNTHILVAVDYVTKWVEAIPTKSADSQTSLKMLSFLGLVCLDIL